MNIGWDYGHGVSFDRGAEGFISEESVINDISSHGEVMLQNLGHSLVWTRPTSASSVNDSLNQRSEKANRNNVDLFVSNHANMAGGNGHEIWVVGLGGQAEAYARKVDRALTSLGSNSRGIKVGNLSVLRKTNAPAILIEYFFLDTKSNVDFYNRVGPYKYAKAVVEAITGQEIPSIEAPTPEPEVVEEVKNGLYYVVSDYLPSDNNKYVNMQPFTSILKEDRFYVRYDDKGVWIETQYLSYDRCEELKQNLGNRFHSIVMD